MSQKHKPFIKKFESTNGNQYIYDVNTSEFLRVDKCTFDIIEDCDSSIDNLSKLWSKEYSVDMIQKSLEEINEQKERGYFKPWHPTKMEPLACEHCIDKKIVGEELQLTFNLTHNCNLRCKYCIYSGLYDNYRTHSQDSMDYNVAKKALDQFFLETKGLKKSFISFYGGEPLLRFDLLEQIVKYANSICDDRQLEFHITTNGTLLNESVIELFRANNFFIQVSLDGPRDIHDRYRVFKNGKGTFDTITSHLDYIEKRDPEYYLKHVCLQITLAPPFKLFEIEEYLQHGKYSKLYTMATFVNLESKRFVDKYLQGNLDYGDVRNQLAILGNKYREERVKGEPTGKLFKALGEKKLIRIHNRKVGKLGDEIPQNGNCIPGARKRFVDVNGEIYPCERTGRAYSLGNVNEVGINHNSVLRVMREYMDNFESDCTSCWLSRICDLCYSQAQNGLKFEKELKEKNCKDIKRNYEYYMSMYLSIMEMNERAFEFADNLQFE